MKFVAEFYGNDEAKAEEIFEELWSTAKTLKWNCECVVINDDGEVIAE